MANPFGTNGTIQHTTRPIQYQVVQSPTASMHNPMHVQETHTVTTKLDTPVAMRSKGANTCHSCGQLFQRGDSIVWYSQSKKVFHAECHKPGVKVLSDRAYAQAKARNASLGTLIRLQTNVLKAQQALAEFCAENGFDYTEDTEE